ncbi:MAG TPA: protein-methionine-sulfoxide reductase heme-binding subunit MsrQ [Roseiflexaceae bacterium]|nr:protein-methionine-sulfoxide reductase heme-binding subunit MsrQ [Roseiflexaceae bacterium]
MTLQNQEPRTENRPPKVTGDEWRVTGHPAHATRHPARFSILNSQFSVLRVLVHIACWIPFVVLIWDFQHDNLTVNPIQEATFRTGKTALVLLALSLACTPANTLFGLKQALPLRRPLGLYAFFYVCIHLLIFAAVDYGLDWELIKEAITEKRYVLVGFTAFLLLLPLAITSTKGWQRRLGKRWKKLHRLVYLAAPLVIVHFYWLVKADVSEPLLFGAAVAVLLLLRLPSVRRAITRLRYRITGRGRAVETGVPNHSSSSD